MPDKIANRYGEVMAGHLVPQTRLATPAGRHRDRRRPREDLLHRAKQDRVWPHLDEARRPPLPQRTQRLEQPHRLPEISDPVRAIEQRLVLRSNAHADAVIRAATRAQLKHERA